MRIPVVFLCMISSLYGQDSCEVCKLILKSIDTVYLRDLKVRTEPARNVSLQLIDNRRDTSKVGYVEKPGLRRSGKENAKVFYPYQLELGTTRALSQMLSDVLVIKSGVDKKISVTGFLKTFWISKTNHLYFSADYFVEKDGLFFPLTRIDTSFVERSSSITGDETVLDQLIQKHKEKFNTLNLERAFVRTGHPLDFIKEKSTLPTHAILVNNVQYKKGIYQSFEEFLANSPGMPFKEIKQEKNTDILYTETANGVTQSVRDVWGFCDGKNLYVKLGFSFFQMVRVNQTFELLGFMEIRRSETWGEANFGGEIAGVFKPTGKYITFYYPIQINMQDGSPYL